MRGLFQPTARRGAAFSNAQELIGRNIAHLLHMARRPLDAQGVDGGGISEAEMDTQVRWVLAISTHLAQLGFVPPIYGRPYANLAPIAERLEAVPTRFKVTQLPVPPSFR